MEKLADWDRFSHVGCKVQSTASMLDNPRIEKSVSSLEFYPSTLISASTLSLKRGKKAIS